jgi:hypothetical protein
MTFREGGAHGAALFLCALHADDWTLPDDHRQAKKKPLNGAALSFEGEPPQIC